MVQLTSGKDGEIKLRGFSKSFKANEQFDVTQDQANLLLKYKYKGGDSVFQKA